MYDKFYKWLVRAAKYPHLSTAPALQDAIVAFLETEGERDAAAWFRETMTGPDENAWMLAYALIGAAANNMGQESYYRWLKKATNSRRNVSLQYFLAAFVTYCRDSSLDEYNLALAFMPDEKVR